MIRHTSTATEPSAIFYAGRDVYSSSDNGILEQDSIETLAITSDVLLLVIDPKAPWDSSISDSVVRGADRRRAGSYSKVGVLVVLTGDIAADEVESWKDRVLSERLSALTPDVVASLDIVTESNADAAYQDVIQDLPDQGMVANKEEYQLMIQQVYQALTSKSCELVFEAAKASFFESETADVELEAPVVESEAPDVESENAVTVDKAILGGEDKATISEADLELAERTLLISTMEELESLESQQDEVWLNEDSQVPLIHFGSAANSILEKASKELPVGPAREVILGKIAGKLQTLYHSQLQSLREHFGRKYETALEKNEGDEQAVTQAAAHITESFRAAAQHAIPEMCKEGQELVDADFSYVAVMQGLISDMMEATSMQPDFVDDDEEEGEEGKKPAKWYKKLAARAIMLGINYVQGWLAWQGVKKAAAQRDRDMPKFPLF
jgi:hypothetical protein